QIQCALGRGTFGAGARYVETRGAKIGFEQREEHEKTEKQLLKLHETRWMQAFRPFVREWGFRRGFVEKAVCDFAKFVDGLPRLSLEPIERVKLTAYKPALLKKIHAAEPHPSLWCFELSRNRLEATDLELLGSRCF